MDYIEHLKRIDSEKKVIILEMIECYKLYNDYNNIIYNCKLYKTVAIEFYPIIKILG